MAAGEGAAGSICPGCGAYSRRFARSVGTAQTMQEARLSPASVRESASAGSGTLAATNKASDNLFAPPPAAHLLKLKACERSER
jgi:hypothetical protein